MLDDKNVKIKINRKERKTLDTLSEDLNINLCYLKYLPLKEDLELGSILRLKTSLNKLSNELDKYINNKIYEVASKLNIEELKEKENKN